MNHSQTRREFLSRASGGFGAVALAGLCSELQAAPDNPLAPRSGHHLAKADRVIFLYSTGGTSHIDTFNHRPQLIADHGKSITASRWLNKSGEFNRFLIKPRYTFKQYGQSGNWVSDLFPHVGSVIDDVCVLNAMHCESDGHDKATLAAHTGSAQFARPERRVVGELRTWNRQSESAIVRGSGSRRALRRSTDLEQRLPSCLPSGHACHAGNRTAAQYPTAKCKH